jgi:hypothetical protein
VGKVVEKKPLGQIVDEMWPLGFGKKPDVYNPNSSLGIILRIVDEIVKQRILEACEEPVEYEKT